MLNDGLNFLKKDFGNPILVALGAGFYPLLHYYNNNLFMAMSWQQITFLVSVCLLLPIILVKITPWFLRFKIFNFFSTSYLSILNFCAFFGLFGVISLGFNKKQALLVLFCAFWVGLLLKKHLAKIVALQFLLAMMSLITLIPKLKFAFTYSNDNWVEISTEELQTNLKERPNIFVIQPDGYANFEDMRKPPYDYQDRSFEDWLLQEGFVNYEGFRSNYYSTLTSNSSLFAMKHHYYQNTNPSTLKTFGATKIITGKENNVVSILKNNGYNCCLLSDNSFFLVDRNTLSFDYSNIGFRDVSFHDPGMVNGVDILTDLKSVLSGLSPEESHFFFIEKTIPGHIYYTKDKSKGKEVERVEYLQRIEVANEWLKSLVLEINEFDSNALIILVADHGGYVGLDYTLEAVEKRMTDLEVRSSFSSLLSIKWPSNIKGSDTLTFRTNVNLFRKILYSLSSERSLVNNLMENSSYIPLKSGADYKYYKCMDENGEVIFKELDK